MFRAFCLTAVICGSLFFSFSPSQAKPRKVNLSAPHVPNQFIVKFKSSPRIMSKGFSPRRLIQRGLRSVKNSFVEESDIQILQQFRSNGAMLVQLPPQMMQNKTADLKAVVEALNAQPEVEYVEPNYIVHARALPNDPMYEDLYALNKSSGRKADIFAQEAWKQTTGSKAVKVAVIDSGVDYTHKDLVGNYWLNPGETGRDGSGKDKSTNGVDDDHNGFVDDFKGWNFVKNNNDPMDDTSHGTHCAGTIGAVGNNGNGTVGVNWNVSIVGLKFLNSEGSGELADAVRAVEYATSLGVDVMSNSWGGDEYSETMAAAIREANAAGIVFVVASGNAGNNNDVGLDYPASYEIENIISVAAVDSEGELAGFSNFGAQSVHIAAPGVQILSTIPGNLYEFMDGTSMAAPYVSGAAALIKARFPELKAREIKARILGGAVPSKALENKVVTGLLNIQNAMADDFTPPTSPSRINVLGSGAITVQMEWEPSTDTGLSKYAFGYEVRKADQPINDENDWENAEPVDLIILQSDKSKVLARAEIYNVNSSGYLSVRAIDRSGNLSDITSSVPFSLKKVSTIYKTKGNSLEGLQVKGPWGVENTKELGDVISDSPGDVYGYGKTVYLTLPPFKVSGSDVALFFKAKYDFEVGYDFGYLEVSADQGANWQQVAQYNGARNWTQHIYSLADYLPGNAKTLLVRFRITSDSTTSHDGWYLADIYVLQ